MINFTIRNKFIIILFLIFTYFIKNKIKKHILIQNKQTKNIIIKNKPDINKLFKNYELVSLGYSCYPALFIKTITKKETNFFDWIGSSSWSILKLLENNFDNVLNKQNYYYPNEIFREHNQKYNITNKEYYLRFIHDGDFLSSENQWNIFRDKYERRINRFNKLLKSNKNILFLYLEENSISRINLISEDIKQYYPQKIENYHIEQSKLEQNKMLDIVNILKTKYNKYNFKIIYLSSFLDKTKYLNNIIFIKTDCHYENYDWSIWSNEQCLKSIINNYGFINNILN